jgi:hypothetical protein
MRLKNGCAGLKMIMKSFDSRPALISYLFIPLPDKPQILNPVMKHDKTCLSLLFLVTLTIASWITSCTHKADISGLPEICFARDVLPIYSNSCAITGCHDGSGEKGALNTYLDIRNSVVPYNPDKSQSYSAIISKWGQNLMPPGQPLSEEKRTIIRVWIEQGANETTCPPAASIYKGKEDKISNFR